MGISWSVQPQSWFVGAGRCAGPHAAGDRVFRPDRARLRTARAGGDGGPPLRGARLAGACGVVHEGIAVMSNMDHDNKDQGDSYPGERDYVRGDQQE